MKNVKPEKSIFTLINQPNANLQSVLAKAKQLHHLHKLLQKFLSTSSLKNHCQVVNLRANSLVIAADSASWCTLLKYEGPKLLDQYRQAGVYSLQSIIFQVQTPDEIKNKKSVAKKIPLLSQENAKYLLEIANDVSHPRLREALEKLGRNCKS